MTNNKQQTPHGFCETPEQKCTMNYCDENGCQNRKRTLAEPTEMPNNKQQTAVEFYLDKVFDIIGDAILDKLSIEQINKIHDLSLQAKEIQKEQHGKTWDKSMDNLDSRGGNMVRAWVDFDEHYNETYGGGEQ